MDRALSRRAEGPRLPPPEWNLDVVVPFFGNDELTRVSPLRTIPVLTDESVAVADSSVSCEYLDEETPDILDHFETQPPEAGAPLTAATFGTEAARPGIPRT